MTIKQIKEEIKSYRDFYGGDISDTEEIDNCKTKAELADILNKHVSFMEDMLADACSHIEQFKKRIGLSVI